MDINNTRFHLLLGEADWSSCTTLDGTPVRDIPTGASAARPSFSWDGDSRELILQPEVTLFTQQSAPQRPVEVDTDRRGVDADRFGNLYWIDEQASEIKVQSADNGEISHYWAWGDGTRSGATGPGAFSPAQAATAVRPLPLSGLAVTHDHYLVVGVHAPRGLLIFDLYTAGPPQQWLWPAAIPFAPFDIAARPQGGVWILDRDQRRVWQLDRLFNVEPYSTASPAPTPAEFTAAYPPDAIPATVESAHVPLTLYAALAVSEENPIAIAPLPDDSFLILDQPATSGVYAGVAHYRFCSGRVGGVSTNVLTQHLAQQSEFVLVAHDFSALPVVTDPPAPTATLHIASADGNQSFAFDYRLNEHGQPQLDARPDFLPMRLFGGKGVVCVRGLPYYDFARGWVPLVVQRRPRYPEQATLLTRIFDGRVPQCVWHRLLLDAVLPPDCTLRVYSRAADDPAELNAGAQAAEWQTEPVLYRRSNGSEIAYSEPATRNNEGTWELLFQTLIGRYAQLKLVITSDQRSTPRLRALRAYYARFSYLTHYLPAVYREDVTSAAFVERFLANFEGTYTAIEDRIAAVQVLFDVRSVPREALPWLADWMGVVLDPAWTEERRRLFMRHAMQFFQWRGTVHGLKMALRLALERCAGDDVFNLETPGTEYRYGIRVIDNFRLRRRGGRWRPDQGEAELSRRYRAALGSEDVSLRYPLVNPADASEAAWRVFSEQMLGFVPAAWEEQGRWQQYLCAKYADVETLNAVYGTAVQAIEQLPMPQDLPSLGVARDDWTLFQKQGQGHARSLLALWHNFLTGRYPTIDGMNDVYGTAWRRFDEVAYPVGFPKGDVALKDWSEFESTLLAMQRGAHRFQVLLPLFTQDDDADVREQHRAHARRIIDLEKPAHTIFEVNYYWAMFLVGTARLGHDTQLDIGSRAPQLAAAAILNQAHLGSSYLNTDFPPPRARRVVGAGALGQGAATGRFHS
jgi:phage tail-like protein